MKIVKLGIDDALDMLRRTQQWTFYYFGEDRDNPELMGAVRKYDGHDDIDVIILVSDTNATAYRHACGKGEPFKPAEITFYYQAPALWTARLVLSLNVPGAPLAPPMLATPIPPPPSCFIPDGYQRRRTIRPPQGPHQGAR